MTRWRPWLIAAGLLVADQWTKWLVATRMPPADSVALIPGIVHLTFVQNTGMAFGLFRGFPGLFAMLALGVAAWIAVELVRPVLVEPAMQWALALILGGAVGNLIDRVRLGYVIDFLDLRVWPVFNLADSAITIGVALLLWQTLRKPSKN